MIRGWVGKWVYEKFNVVEKGIVLWKNEDDDLGETIPVVVLPSEQVEEIKLILLGVIEWIGESVAADQLQNVINIVKGE